MKAKRYLMPVFALAFAALCAGAEDGENAFAEGASEAFAIETRLMDDAWSAGALEHGGGTLTADETWAAGSVHVVYGTVVVATNATLTIEPGAVVKFLGGGIIAAGTCVANGATFTDIADGGGLAMPSYVLKGNIATDAATCIRFAKNGDEFAADGASNVFAISLRTDAEIPAGAVEHGGGTLTADETWSAGSVHVVYGTVIVATNATLTIEPGAVVKFLGGGIIAAGTCVANGVTFTDIADGGGLAMPSYVLKGNIATDAATRIRFAKNGDGAAADGGSGAFSIDMSDDEFRLAHEEEAISFSSAWANGTGVKVSVVKPDGGIETLVNESGAAAGIAPWAKPAALGLYELRHESGGETLTAKFAVVDGVVHDGTIAEGETWGKGKVHIVGNNLKVADGATLTIEPGAVVKFLDGKTLTIEAGGACVAEGVVFTSIHDDTAGGDSFNDGGATAPSTNGYAIVGFVRDDLATEYRYGVQSYTGTLAGEVTWRKERTYVIDGTLTVATNGILTIPAGTVVKFTEGSGIKVAAGGVCMAEGAVFTHIADDAVGGDTMGDGDATVPEYGKYTVDVAVLDSDETEYRYSAPIVTSGTLNGSNVWRARQVYHVTGNLTLASGATLTIAPGSVVKFNPNTSLTVNSGAILNAQGTRAAPIVFTSLKDDDHGGDTNGDGDATVPNPGDWVKICVNGGVANFNYAKVLYSSKNATTGAINMTGSGGTTVFVNGEIAHAAYDAIGVESGNCHVTNSVIHDCLLAFRHWTKDPIVNCVIYDCGRLTQGGGQHFYNCIFSRITETWEAFGFPQNGTTYNNCCFWNEGGSVLTAEGPQDAMTVCGKDGNIWGDPLFVDPANGDFRIAADSPCVDAGDATIALAKDWFGQPRQGTAPEIGIYETLPRYVESDIDLGASGVRVSDVWRIGEEEGVLWNEENVGTAIAAGGWMDKIELVPSWNMDDRILVAEFQTVLNLSAGAVSQRKRTVRVPIVPEGEYFVRVTVNHARNVFEGTLDENNSALSGLIRVETMAVNAADGGKGSLPPHGEGMHHFSIAPGYANRLVVIKADGGVTALFGAGRVPTDTANIGTVSYNGGRLCFLVPEDVSDVYVRLGNPTSSVVSYEIDFNAGSMAILGLATATIPYDGRTTVQLTGAGFGGVSEVMLRAAGGGGDVKCGQWETTDDSAMNITIDGTGLVQGGVYNIVLRDSDGKDTVSAQAVTVTSEPAMAKAWAQLVVPENVREGRPHLCQIRYGNDGNADAIAPIFEVSRKGDGTFSLAGDDNRREKLYFVGAGASGNAGILLPHEEGVIEFFYVAGTTQVEGADILLHMACDAGIADAATRLGRRGDDATNYAKAKELAQLVSSGMTNGVCYGTVKDSNGEPVGDYLVAVTNGDSVVRALTDANGRYVTEPCRIDDMRVDFTVAALSASSYVEVEGATENTVVFAEDRISHTTFISDKIGVGRYVFRGIPEGVYAIEAHDGERVGIGCMNVADGEYGIVPLALDVRGSVEGCFIGDGRDSNPHVLLVSSDAERIAGVDSGGMFRFPNLPSGEYLLMYCGKDYGDYTMAESLVVSAGVSARFDIIKTNNIFSVGASVGLRQRLRGAKVFKSASDSYLSTIQHYLRLLDAAPPQPPPPDRDCAHNRKLYRKDKIAYLGMHNYLLAASRKCDDLAEVEQMIAENRADILKEGASQAISIAKNCKKLMALMPALIQMIRTYELTGKAQSFGFEPEKANEFCLNIVDALLNAKDYSVAMAHLANAFNGLKAFRSSLTRFTLHYEKMLIKTLGKGGLDLCRDALAIANTVVALKNLYDSAKVRYDLLQSETVLRAELAGVVEHLDVQLANVLQCRSYPLCCNGDEEDDFDDPPEDKKKVHKKKSKDPNEVAGPSGVGEKRFVKPGEWMTYTVYFENVSNATAAAQEVYVTNPLSEWLDWSTFEMGEVAFNNQNDLGLSGKSGGTCEATMKGTNFIVRTVLGGGSDGKGDVATSGVAHWYLRIVDPSTETGWPADVTAGFLPPNDETFRGEGHLTYRIKVRDDAPANVVITNSATIVFDYNDPIETDPAWWNTVGASGAAFAESEVEANEGETATIKVMGGNADAAASVKVYLTYNTAAAADLDLANGEIDGETPKGGLKFPLALTWEKGEMGEKVITIPVKTDKTVEGDEFFTLQLAEAEGMELGEERVCTVTIRDATMAAGKETLQDAVNNAVVKMSTSGKGKWAYANVGTGGEAAPGKTASASAMSPVLKTGQTAELKAAAVKGSGTLTFDVRVANDALEGESPEAAEGAAKTVLTLLDGKVELLAWTNETDWTSASYTVEEAKATSHAFTWRVVQGADLGAHAYVANVVWSPAGTEMRALTLAAASYIGGEPCDDSFSGGTVSGEGVYPDKTKISLAATAKVGWEFVGWAHGGDRGATALPGDGDGRAGSPLPAADGEILSNKTKWQVVVTNDAEYVAVFEKIPYVRGLADPADGGKVSGSGLCARGKKVTLKATANKNFAFLGWVRGGRGATALPGDGDGRAGSPLPADENGFVATTPSLVIDRSAKPTANSKTSTTVTEIDGDVTYFAVFKSDPRVTVSVESTKDEGAALTGKGAGKYVAGTITGAGKYAPGKKVTLKATANKNYVFAGWACGGRGATALPGDVVSQAASLSFTMPSNDVEYVAMFVTADEDKGSIELEVNGEEMAAQPESAPYRTNIWAGVYLEWPVATSALFEPKVKVAGLPSGLKFTDKPVTSKIGSGKTAVTVTNVLANTIYGAPTAASKIDKNTGAAKPSAVKITVTTAGKSSQTYQIDTVVDALPAWAQGTFAGGGRGAPALPGQVSLTVSAAGKVSGKALGDGFTYTLAAPYYTGFEEADGVSNFVADVTASWSYKEGTKTVKTNDVVQVVVQDNGIGGVAMGGPLFSSAAQPESAPYHLMAWQYNWKAEPWKTLGKKFDKKTLTYAILDDGTFSEDEEVLTSALGADVTARVTLKFAASGAVSVAGEFAMYDKNKAKYTTVKASGSATLVPVDDEHGEVFIYLLPKGLPPHARSVRVPWSQE